METSMEVRSKTIQCENLRHHGSVPRLGRLLVIVVHMSDTCHLCNCSLLFCGDCGGFVLLRMRTFMGSRTDSRERGRATLPTLSFFDFFDVDSEYVPPSLSNVITRYTCCTFQGIHPVLLVTEVISAPSNPFYRAAPTFFLRKNC